jgi:nitric oxide dioxygenase
MLTDDHIKVIKSTIPILENAGSALTSHFYKRMFDHNPELMHIFNMSNQASGRQQLALFEAIAAYAKNIENLAALSTAVERIAQKHTSMNIQASHYAIVGHHLIETLRELASPAFDTQVEEAWTAAYQFLASIFIDRESQIYQDKLNANGGWNGRREFIISNKEIESELVTSFTLTPSDNQGVVEFHSGQYIGLEVHPKSKEHREIRQYSLSDRSNTNHYRISVKREQGEHLGTVSNFLHDSSQIGDTIHLYPPAGDFFFVDKGRNVALISAGVGITPMQSMLEHLHAINYPHKVSFLHACENNQQHSFKQRTNTLCEADNYEQYTWYRTGQTSETNQYQGFINLPQTNVNLFETDFYICGPIPFMQFMKEQLLELKVSEEHIHYEVFGPHQNI